MKSVKHELKQLLFYFVIFILFAISMHPYKWKHTCKNMQEVTQIKKEIDYPKHC